MVPGEIASEIVRWFVKTGQVVGNQRGGTGMMAATGIAVLFALVKTAVAAVIGDCDVAVLATGVSGSLNALVVAHVHHHTIGLQRHDHKGQAQQERTDCPDVISHNLLYSGINR